MFKLLLVACLLAFAVASPKPSATFYSGYYPAVGSTYTAYSNYAPYAAGYYGNYGYYGYGAAPYYRSLYY
ncbi:hypothetical protein QE152_g13970 [Popillia japonica]|uniref:Neuropeptide-like 4 n=1 Tax=Popillia japonica TaxID=7064 RepID=A0AAW1LBN2_POPJA